MMTVRADQRRAQRGLCSRRFSFVELLVACGLLMAVFVLIFKLFVNLHGAYGRSLRQTNVAENARLAFDLVARDLSSAVSRRDDMPGMDIEFHQPDQRSLWFVACGEGHGDSLCNLLEVGYRLENGELQRAFVDDTCDDWNVYGARDDADDQGGYHRVISGVVDLEFTCYGDRMIPYRPAHADSLPRVVAIRLTVVDDETLRRWLVSPPARRAAMLREYGRTFRKTVYIGGPGGNA